MYFVLYMKDNENKYTKTTKNRLLMIFFPFLHLSKRGIKCNQAMEK